MNINELRRETEYRHVSGKIVRYAGHEYCLYDGAHRGEIYYFVAVGFTQLVSDLTCGLVGPMTLTQREVEEQIYRRT